MDKLACLKYVVEENDIADNIKIAALNNYVTHIESLELEEEKVAALSVLQDLISKEAALAPSLLRWARTLGRQGAAGGVRNRLGSWLANSIRGTRGAAAAGGGLLKRWGVPIGTGLAIGGGGLIAGQMQKNDAFKQGYGAATSQVGPMLAATMGSRGAMGMQRQMV